MSLTSMAIAFLGAWGLTAITLFLARRYGIVDAPNRRSSHVLPTPTLGGCAILGATLLGVWCDDAQGRTSLTVASMLLLLFVADDLRRPLGVTTKAGLQIVAATVWVVASHFSAIHLPLTGPLEGLGVSILAVFWLVAWMNAFNFMDGIDAISSVQTIVAGITLAVIFAYLAPGLEVLPLCLAAAAAGFLVFNLPPARIFMGDVGSAFLGLCFGVITLQAMSQGLAAPLVLLPLSLYGYDTSLTILRRACRGENVLRAHRQHLYQRLVQRGWSHARVSMAVGMISTGFGVAAFAVVTGRMGLAIFSGLLSFATLVTGSIVTWRQPGDVSDA